MKVRINGYTVMCGEELRITTKNLASVDCSYSRCSNQISLKCSTAFADCSVVLLLFYYFTLKKGLVTSYELSVNLHQTARRD